MERPIIFNSEMVRAILDSRKTQTRRVIKGEIHISHKSNEVYGNYHWHPLHGKYMEAYKKDTFLARLSGRSPYGKVGDLLYVRESWQPLYAYCNPSIGIVGACFRHRGGGRKFNPKFKNTGMHIDDTYPNKPSIHMPKWATQVWLEITGIRVERAKDISEADVLAEGIEKHCTPTENGISTPTTRFVKLWDSINAKRGYGWKLNPWVWVIEFKKVNNAKD